MSEYGGPAVVSASGTAESPAGIIIHARTDKDVLGMNMDDQLQQSGHGNGTVLVHTAEIPVIMQTR